MRSKVAEKIMAQIPQETKIFVRLYADLVVRINQLIKDQGLNQKLLAEKLDKNPSEINKWLSGEHNFTLRSLAKLEAELGEQLLFVPKQRYFSHFAASGGKTKVTVYNLSLIHISEPTRPY
mgnify:CR=1 FL=1